MKTYDNFVFESYEFEPSSRLACFKYSYDGVVFFSETYTFNFELIGYSPQALDRALQLLFFMAGVSYYKMYLAPNVLINAGQIDEPLAKFLNETYRLGLGEFCYVNQLPLIGDVFTPNITALNPIVPLENQGILIGLGGGKDSLVTTELLKDDCMATWSVGHKKQLQPLITKTGLPHYSVERSLDANLQNHNANGAYNGHIPISAILACAGVVVAVLAGKRDVVVSNEQSANEATLEYKGLGINHQYSKSQQFEESFQQILGATFSNSIRYYSLLRPFSELYIAELFSTTGFETYKDVFCSCNQAFKQGQEKMFWDGTCAKCAFVFLILTPFIDRALIENIFDGKNLLLDDKLEQTYEQLLGISGDKPLDCIGEVRESRFAMHLAQQIYPTLSKYKFELDLDYDYKAWQQSSMPSEILALLQAKLR